MSRYIDKDTLLNRIVSLEQLARKRVDETPTNSPCYERYVAQMQDREHIISIIKAMPTADVVEVRHGEWGFDGLGWTCSECGEYGLTNKAKMQVHSTYCPNCGALMDGNTLSTIPTGSERRDT